MLELIWRARDGRFYRVADMQTSHIVNCIRMIERKWPWRSRYYERLKLEFEMRAIDQERTG